MEQISIVAHNHPSGDSTLSEEDVTLTQKLVETGRFMNIPVVDHLILDADGRTFRIFQHVSRRAD